MSAENFTEDRYHGAIMETGVHCQDSSSCEILRKKNLVVTGTGMPGHK